MSLVRHPVKTRCHPDDTGHVAVRVATLRTNAFASTHSATKIRKIHTTFAFSTSEGGVGALNDQSSTQLHALGWEMTMTFGYWVQARVHR